MKRISIGQIMIVFLVLFLLSRTGVILNWFKEQHLGEIFTLQPLLDQPVQAHYVLTLLAMALVFVICWTIYLNKQKRNNKDETKKKK